MNRAGQVTGTQLPNNATVNISSNRELYVLYSCSRLRFFVGVQWMSGFADPQH